MDWFWQTVCDGNNHCISHYFRCHVPDYGYDFKLPCRGYGISCSWFYRGSHRMDESKEKYRKHGGVMWNLNRQLMTL